MALADDRPLRHLPDRLIRESLRNPANRADFLADVVPELAPHFDCGKALFLDRLFPLDGTDAHPADVVVLATAKSGEGKTGKGSTGRAA